MLKAKNYSLNNVNDPIFQPTHADHQLSWQKKTNFKANKLTLAANLSKNTSKSYYVEEDVAFTLTKTVRVLSLMCLIFIGQSARILIKPEPKLLAAECCICPCRKQVRNASKGKVSRTRALCFHLNIALHTCMPKAPHIHSHLTSGERERARERVKHTWVMHAWTH